MSNNIVDPGPVPQRWLRCPRKSSGLLINKFLIFKTPLSHRFDDQVPEEHRFPVEFIFDSMKSYKVKVGLWIDLTNTTRFYDKSEVESNDCRYVKMQCKGHGQAPTDDQTEAFVHVCDNFIKQNPLEVIGVHCTHGFNRSGFLVVSYLVKILDWELEKALQEFASVRSPGIYKNDYLLELYRRYDDVNDASEPPELPDWCYDDSVEDDDYQPSQSTSNKRKHEDEDGDNWNRKRKKEFVKKNPTFMEGVMDVEAVGQQLLGAIQKKVQEMCGWNSTGFPGSQPVSMDMNNIKNLSEKPYMVSWKADGVRYLMYIKGANEIYCIDRDNCVFKINNLTFPFRKDLRVHIKNTLLDGEMVMDVVDGVKIPRYLVYDIIYINGYAIKDLPFMSFDRNTKSRYQAIEEEIYNPRLKAMALGCIKRQDEPFSIRPKEFHDAKNAFKFLEEKFVSKLAHEPDGLIFQPARNPYVAGCCSEVLKWKPSSLNSVDFKLKITWQQQLGAPRERVGELYVGGKDSRFGLLESIKNVKELSNKIIECTYNNKKDRWVFLRERTDKSFPNSFSTAEAVYNSIRNPITKEFLLQYIQVKGFRDLNREMPPPTSRPPQLPHR